MSDISPSIAASAVPAHVGTRHEPTHAAPEHGHGNVAHQFDDAAQQKEAVTLGMWAFLATEIMFFGGAFLLYSIYRNTYPEAFTRASQLENWKIGAFNTAVLLVSSLTVVLAVRAAHMNNSRGVINWLIVTILCALVFFGVKAYEYNHLYHEHLIPGRNFDAGHVDADGKVQYHFGDYNSPDPAEVDRANRMRRGAQIFFSFYFCATGLHALHMVVGVAVFLWVIRRAMLGAFSADYYNPVEVSGLYWHFVDIVWIFLYPMLYLIDLSSQATGH